MALNIYYNRLETLWKHMGFDSANEFAKSLGWSRAENILRLKREGNELKKPGVDILEDIMKAHPQFNFQYLLTGDDRFLKDKYPGKNSIKDTIKEPNRDYTEPMSPNERCDNPNCLKRISELEQDKQLLIDYNGLLRAQLARGGLDHGKSAQGGVEKSPTGS